MGTFILNEVVKLRRRALDRSQIETVLVWKEIMEEELFQIAIKSRVYHADLFAAAQKMGSVRALADYLGVGPATLGDWIRLDSFPSLQLMTKDGRKRTNLKLAKKWPLIAKRLFELTGKTIEQLFPDFVRLSGALEASKETISIREVNAGTMLESQHRALAIPFFEKEITRSEVAERITRVLNTLTEREKAVLELRFGLNGHSEHTFAQAGEALRVSPERIRQIEMRAIRKLNHPDRAHQLKSSLEAIDFNECPKCKRFFPSFEHCPTCPAVFCGECMPAHLRSHRSQAG